MDISTVIGSKFIPSNTYQVPLIDALNVQHIITAFEVENISEKIIEVNVSGVTHKFSFDVQRGWHSLQARLVLVNQIC